MISRIAFLLECFRVLWMVFFRPKSFDGEVERFDRARRFIAAGAIISFLLVAIIGLLIVQTRSNSDFIPTFVIVAVLLVTMVAFWVWDEVTHLATYTFERRAMANLSRQNVNELRERSHRALLRPRTVEEIAQSAPAVEWQLPQRVSGAKISSILRWKDSGGDVPAAYRRCNQIHAEVRAALNATSNYQKLAALNRASRQLDSLREFAITDLRGRESRIFVQVAQQWLDAVNAEIDRLTQEESATESIPNPYVAPRPLSVSDEVFVGRTEVFRFVEERFLRADQNVPIILHGQPRIGKSSVLHHFETHLPTNLIPVYVDMQRSAQVESTGGLLYNLADAVAQQLNRRGVSLPAPALADFAAEPFIVFGKFLDNVEEAIHAPTNRIVLALDEFEEIERKLTEGKVSGDLMPFLRNMMQHRPGFALLFAGTHTLEEMIQEHWTPYFRSALPCRVSYLNADDARKLITNPIASFPLDYEPEAVTLLMETTHCHPCLIQLASSALVDLKNRQRSRCASVEDVRQALTKALETGDYVFRGIWDWIPHNERSILSALAAQQASIPHLAGMMHRPEAEIRYAVERLVGVEVIEMVAESDAAAYRFQVELFRQWVERNAPYSYETIQVVVKST